MTVWEVLLLWFGLIENKACDLEQQGESTRSDSTREKKEVFLGSSTGGAHLTAEPVMPSSILFIPEVCMQTSDSQRQHKVLGRDLSTTIDPSGSEVCVTWSPPSFGILARMVGENDVSSLVGLLTMYVKIKYSIIH